MRHAKESNEKFHPRLGFPQRTHLLAIGFRAGNVILLRPLAHTGRSGLDVARFTHDDSQLGVAGKGSA